MARRDQSVFRRRRIAAGTGLCAVLAAAVLGLEGIVAEGRVGPDPKQLRSTYMSTIADEDVIGQMLMVRMDGVATPTLLRQARRGEIGGVIVFPYPGQPVGELRRELRRVQRAARGRPRLLVSIDQEGGEVKRLSEGPPDAPPRQLGRRGPTDARREGAETGAYLARIGIGVDLAPVLDVPSPGSFIAERSFADDAETVAAVGTAFAEGLRERGTAAAAKHFPGLGRATANTDFAPSEVEATAEELDADLAPFREAIAAGVPMVMVGHASYPGLGSELPAALSEPIVTGLLRERLGFGGVTISDDLDAEAVRAAVPERRAPVAAAQAGIDVLLLARTVDGRDARSALLEALTGGELDRDRVERALERILELKGSL